jgi:hypothetical protein
MDENSRETPDVVDIRANQWRVAAGMLAALFLVGLVGGSLWYGSEGRLFVIVDRSLTLADRLSYVAKWSLLPAACVMMGVAMVANIRFFTSSIDPISGVDENALKVWRAFTQNSIEQAFLFIVGAAAFACITYQYWLRLIPILAILFVIGRIIFVIGYLIKPAYRATGFAMTFYPIVFLYAITTYLYIYQ